MVRLGEEWGAVGHTEATAATLGTAGISGGFLRDLSLSLHPLSAARVTTVTQRVSAVHLFLLPSGYLMLSSLLPLAPTALGLLPAASLCNFSGSH